MPEKRCSRRRPRQPSYRLHKARGCAVVTINGKNHYLGPYNSPESHEKYARLIAQWRANGKELSALVDSTANRDLTVSGLILKYLEFAAGYYKDYGSKNRGEICNLTCAVRPLKKLYGCILSRDFSPEALENVRQSMIDAGLARSTINQRVTRIKRLFRWGARKGLVPPSVYHGLRAVGGLKRGRTAARETEPVKPVTEEHLHATRLHLNKHVRAMVEVQELTGMRPQDIRNLRSCDLDMTGEIWVYQPFTHKNDHLGLIRRIAIGPRAQAILKPFLKPDNQQCFVFSPREAAEAVRAERRKKRKTPRTPSESKRVRKPNPKRQPGDQYTKDAYRWAIVRACDKAKVSHWHPHQLRHNCATKVRRLYGLSEAFQDVGSLSHASEHWGLTPFSLRTKGTCSLAIYIRHQHHQCRYVALPRLEAQLDQFFPGFRTPVTSGPGYFRTDS